MAGPYSTLVGSIEILVEKQGHVLSATIMIRLVCGIRLTLKGLEKTQKVMITFLLIKSAYLSHSLEWQFVSFPLTGTGLPSLLNLASFNSYKVTCLSHGLGEVLLM